MRTMSAEMPELPPLLTASGLTLSRGGRELFTGLDLDLRAGTALLVRGPNGAGKSSLLLALAEILRLDGGRIGWRDGDETPPSHLLAHATGLKASLTVGENLHFWRTLNGPTGLTVIAALDAVGLGGLEAVSAGHLSAGQGKRLALARLLVSRRLVWLLDEPTAALDASGQTLLGRLIADHLRGGGGAIIATHDEIAGLADAPTLTLEAA